MMTSLNEQMDMSQVIDSKQETAKDESACLKIPEIQDFIEERNIRQEDFGLIVAAFDLPREVFLENHNTISLRKDRAGEYFEQSITLLEGRQKEGQNVDVDLAYSRIMHEFCTKYNWGVAWNFNSKMEKVALKKLELQERNSHNGNA